MKKIKPSLVNFSDKQKEYFFRAKARWNLKVGAVRSGKSFVDTQLIIPLRIYERKGLKGLNVIIGVSRETIERNVLQPMRETYGEELITAINSSTNKCHILGEEVYCLGAEKESQVAKLQGMSIKYCYGDEVAKWNSNVFEMLKSRLDKSYSCFDGSLNPEAPTHWLKKFIDDDKLNKYVQHYTIFDNPHLPKEFVEALCQEYQASEVSYNRFILGQWCLSEGAIYKKYADNPSRYRVSKEWLDEHPIIKINIGIDFSLGGSASDHTFVATGFTRGYKEVVVLESLRLKGTETPPDKLEKKFVEFIQYMKDKYKDYLLRYNCSFNAYCDAADQILITGLRVQAERNRLPVNIHSAKKMSINERITLVLRLIGIDRLFVSKEAETVNNALIGAVWSNKIGHEDERLDDGTSDIDTLDAFEYSLEYEYNSLLNALERG